MPEEQHATATTEPAKTDAPPSGSSSSSTSMHVKVYAPFKVYFDGEAASISAANTTGPFDILPRHHNFMTLLSPCDIIVRGDHGEEKIAITRGIMHVKADQVVVFLDV
jgi:F0F1-type ATP synthase epsilon subunit